MARAEKINTAQAAHIEKEKGYVRVSGIASVARAYFKETHESIENTEIDSKGLYVFEKLTRQAFTEAMQDDAVLGINGGFVSYIDGLNDVLDTTTVMDWRPEASAERMSDFMLSFYNMYSYQWKRHGRAARKTLIVFLDIMHECLDFAYLKLNKKFHSLPEEVKNIINKTFFLANGVIDEWYQNEQLEIPAV
ncbi:MAG TPA: hypothetical protein VGK02_06510 [Candidatus Aquicultor sp.]|jgi:hypothetical protein